MAATSQRDRVLKEFKQRISFIQKVKKLMDTSHSGVRQAQEGLLLLHNELQATDPNNRTLRREIVDKIEIRVEFIENVKRLYELSKDRHERLMTELYEKHSSEIREVIHC